jgi:hypothetical protein
MIRVGGYTPGMITLIITPGMIRVRGYTPGIITPGMIRVCGCTSAGVRLGPRPPDVGEGGGGGAAYARKSAGGGGGISGVCFRPPVRENRWAVRV